MQLIPTIVSKRAGKVISLPFFQKHREVPYAKNPLD